MINKRIKLNNKFNWINKNIEMIKKELIDLSKDFQICLNEYLKDFENWKLKILLELDNDLHDLLDKLSFWENELKKNNKEFFALEKERMNDFFDRLKK